MKSDHVRFNLCSVVCCLFYFLLTLPLSVRPVIAPRPPRTNPPSPPSRFYPECQIPSFPWVYHQRELPSLLFLSPKIHLVNVGNWRAFGNNNHWNRYNSVKILDWGEIRHEGGGGGGGGRGGGGEYERSRQEKEARAGWVIRQIKIGVVVWYH